MQALFYKKSANNVDLFGLHTFRCCAAGDGVPPAVCRLCCEGAATNGKYSSGSANYEADEFTAAGVVDGVDDTASVDFVNGGYAVFKVSAYASTIGTYVFAYGSECFAASSDDFITAAGKVSKTSSGCSSHNIILYV